MPKTLTLASGKSFTVRDRLKVRDKREIHTYAVDGVAADRQTYRFNVVKHQIATAAARIMNWDLVDDLGKEIPWPTAKPFRDRIDAIESLDEKVFEELTDVLNAHLEALEAEQEKEKNDSQSGETGSA